MTPPLILIPGPGQATSQARTSRPAALTARTRTLTASAIRAARLTLARVRHGRPGILALRLLGTAGMTIVTAHSGAGPGPITGTLTGIGIWLAVTIRRDLAPPPGR